MVNDAGVITRRTVKATNDLFDSLKHMYSRTDFRNALCELFEKARDVYSCKKKLCIMLKKAGISFENGLSPEKYLPLLKENAPDIMVNFTGFEKQAEKAFSHLEDKYPPTKSSEFAALRMMFKSLDINAEPDREMRYYYCLIENADLTDGREYEDRILDALFENYKQYPSPEMFMQRLVSSLAHKNNRNENESVRLRILKQFVLECGCLSGWYGGKKAVENYAKEKSGASKLTPEETAAALDDDIFPAMQKKLEGEISEKQKALGDSFTKDKRRTIEDKYELLKVCEDLAKGRFKVQFGTKKALYLFAVAFNMTYYSGEPDEIFDPVSDIEKNLFNDYYSNSFFRFLNDDYMDSRKKAGLDCDFTGEGINYKNFAEMIFIYCISQDISAAEKLAMAKRLIDETKGSGVSDHADVGTKVYRKLFTGDIIAMDENHFASFIKENYDCGSKSGNPFALCSSKNSAFAVHSTLMDELCEEIKNANRNTEKLMNRLAEISMFNQKTADRLYKNAEEHFDALVKSVRIVRRESDNSDKSFLDAFIDRIKNKREISLEKIRDNTAHGKNDLMADIFRTVSEFYGSAEITFKETEDKVFGLMKEFWTNSVSYAVSAAKRALNELKKAAGKNEAAAEKCSVKDIAAVISAGISVDDNVRELIRNDIEVFSDERTSTGGYYRDKMTLGSCRSGLWFFDPLNMKSYKKRSRSAAWTEYIELLSAINGFMGCERNSESLIKAFERDKNTVSRACLITVFYYRYIIREEENNMIGTKSISFEDIFNEIKEELDKYLAAAYYPEFSGKNIFDVCAALSAYSYITQ